VANGNGDAVMFSRATFYVQECPTCGRQLQVRVDYLGKSVRCQHCGAPFQARDPAVAGSLEPEQSGGSIMSRVDQLLASAEKMLNPPQFPL
jgi:tRNA G26 N,N-dimethylase Trm1